MKHITAILFSIIILFSFTNIKAELFILEKNENLPNLTFKLQNDEELDFKKYLEDQVVNFIIINFWATWCTPCIKELPSLNNLAVSKEFENIEIWAISLDRGKTSTFSSFLEEKGGKDLKFAHDKKWESARKLGIKGIPETLIIKKINSSVKIISRYSGSLDWDTSKIINDLKKIISK